MQTYPTHVNVCDGLTSKLSTYWTWWKKKSLVERRAPSRQAMFKRCFEKFGEQRRDICARNFGIAASPPHEPPPREGQSSQWTLMISPRQAGTSNSTRSRKNRRRLSTRST